MMRDRMTAHITAWHCARNVEALLPAYTEFGIPADAQVFSGRLRAGCEWLEFREAWGLDVFGLFLRTLVIIAIYPCH